MNRQEKLDWYSFWTLIVVGVFDVYLIVSPYSTISQVIHGWPKVVMLGVGFLLSGLNIWAIQKGYANAALSFIRALVIGHVFFYF